ncbi:MAG: GTPase ObgE [Clostridia bacterium]|nr:GTPase ObgE [Clostridia bacterium]
MFLDNVKIVIKSGNGGNGSVSFHTEKFVPNGGPDGGDGGNGGSIVFVASTSVNTLNDFYYKRKYYAPDGANGSGKKCFGKKGQDMIITVPVGTVIKDYQTGSIIADMFAPNQHTVVLKGGKGGRGNYHFATPRRQAPHFAQNGEQTKEREITLELKTIADVGLIGYPNVGKSTLLSVVSNANPKIADYHFTTLNPNLGVVLHYNKTFVVADIPGLIEGASQGVGLGHSFLRHIERTRLLVHIVDISGSEQRDPIEDFNAINKELCDYSKLLSTLPQIVVANKMDMPNAEDNLVKFTERFGDQYKIFPTMTAINEGIKPLLDEIVRVLDTLAPIAPIEYQPFEYEREDTFSYAVVQLDKGVYEVSGGFIDNLARKIYLDDTDSFRYFQNILKKRGVIDALKEKGMQEGDTVVIADIEFEYME